MFMYADFTFIIKYSDNSYKVKLIVKDMSYDGLEKLHVNYWGNYWDSAELTLNNFNHDLNTYMKSETF